MAGYCAYSDTGCASGLRFDTFASEGLAGECVLEGDAGIDAPSNAVTYVFGEAPSATHQLVTADTYLSTGSGLNYGADNRLRIRQGDDNGLIEFDISAIAPGATVFSATLTLVVTDPGVGTKIEVRPLVEQWVEGSSAGAPGRCNWNERDDVPNLWTTAGAAPPGSAGSVVATLQPTSIGPVNIGLPAALIHTWLDPAQNHGVLLIASQDGADLASSEESPSTDRPILTVTFVP